MNQKDLYDVAIDKAKGENKLIWIMLTIAAALGLLLVTNWPTLSEKVFTAKTGNAILSHISLSLLFGSFNFLLSALKIERINSYFILRNRFREGYFAQFGRNNVVSRENKKFNVVIHYLVLLFGALQFVMLYVALSTMIGFSLGSSSINVVGIELLR